MILLWVIPGGSGDLVVRGTDLLLGGKERCNVQVFRWLLHPSNMPAHVHLSLAFWKIQMRNLQL